MWKYNKFFCLVAIFCYLLSTSLPVVRAAESNDPNRQAEKITFITPTADDSTTSPNVIKKPLSEFQLMAGTLIPGVMISGVNSDLPGQILGQVSQNVYNTVTGQHLVIPQGTKIIGQYDSNVSFGQKRVLVVWTRLIFPNGNSLSLEKMEGVDMSGYAGFHDKVNNHNGRIFKSVVLGSVLTAAAQISTSQNSSDNSYQAAAGSGVAQNVANTTQNMLNKNLSIQPTLTIRPGYQFNIFLTKDLIFLEPYLE